MLVLSTSGRSVQFATNSTMSDMSIAFPVKTAALTAADLMAGSLGGLMDGFGVQQQQLFCLQRYHRVSSAIVIAELDFPDTWSPDFDHSANLPANQALFRQVFE